MGPSRFATATVAGTAGAPLWAWGARRCPNRGRSWSYRLIVLVSERLTWGVVDLDTGFLTDIVVPSVFHFKIAIIINPCLFKSFP